MSLLHAGQSESPSAGTIRPLPAPARPRGQPTSRVVSDPGWRRRARWPALRQV